MKADQVTLVPALSSMCSCLSFGGEVGELEGSRQYCSEIGLRKDSSEGGSMERGLERLVRQYCDDLYLGGPWL